MKVVESTDYELSWWPFSLAVFAHLNPDPQELSERAPPVAEDNDDDWGMHQKVM